MADDEMREHQSHGDPFLAIVYSMEEAQKKAWEALAGYKFWMFGYHAARWVNYNQLLPGGRRFRNPFSALVHIGREHADGMDKKLPAFEFDQVALPLDGAHEPKPPRLESA